MNGGVDSDCFNCEARPTPHEVRVPHSEEHLAKSAGMLNSYRADLVAYHMLQILVRI